MTIVTTGHVKINMLMNNVVDVSPLLKAAGHIVETL
jgi:hypothetical protein